MGNDDPQKFFSTRIRKGWHPDQPHGNGKFGGNLRDNLAACRRHFPHVDSDRERKREGLNEATYEATW